MKACFAEVLARERVCLAEVTTGKMLAAWRRRVVEEVMSAQSPYALALRQTDGVADRADFLDQWRELIAKAVRRLLKAGGTKRTEHALGRSQRVDVDVQRTAVLILAALHGGSTLSHIAQDRQPLNAALDLALVTLVTDDNDPHEQGTCCPLSSTGVR